MISLPQKAQSIIDVLAKNGFEAYAVGGSVRDLLMGKPTKGWDYTTNAKPEEIVALFPDSFYDNQFGTVGIKIHKETGSETEKELEDIYEITTYRSEKGYRDFRHPDTITWGTDLMEDLARRDFTINAIVTDGKKIVDPYNGQSDITKKIIRAVGNPDERFGEDALRMMRAIRIAAEIGFTIDPATFEAIKTNCQLIKNISWERIRDELLKIIKSPYRTEGILFLKNTGILGIILPELDRSFETPQKSPHRHHLYDVGTHSVMALKYCPSKDPIVLLATLLHDIGKPPTAKKDANGVITFYNHEVVGARLARIITTRLRLSKKDSDKVFTLIRWHQFSVDERQTDSAIRRIIRRVSREYMDDMLNLRVGDRLGGGALETSWRLELFKKRLIEVQKQPFSVKDLLVNGNDVMEIFECKPGPIVGDTLSNIFTLVEEGTLTNDREQLLNKVRELRLSKAS